MKAYVKSGAAILVAMVAMTSCGSGAGSKSTNEPGTKEFKLGLTAPLTGTSAATGEEIKNAATMALEKADYKVGDYTIVPVWIDEAGDPAVASKNLTSAIASDKIGAGCLNWQSSDAVAMMDVVARYKVPYFFGMGATSIVNEKFTSDKDRFGYWMAKGYPIPGNVSKLYASAIDSFVADGTLTLQQGKRVALWAEDTDWGHSFAKSQADAFTAAGWTIVDTQFVSANATEFLAMLTKFKDKQVSVIAGTNSSPQGMSAFLKQAKDTATGAILVADGLGYIGDFYKATGDASDGVLDMTAQFASDDAKAFVADFTKAHGSAPGPTAAGISYDLTGFCLKVLKTTLDKYGDLTSEHIFQVGRDQLWTGQLTYTDGIMMPSYKYSAESLPDPVVAADAYAIPVVQYEGGKANLVFPKSSGSQPFTSR